MAHDHRSAHSADYLRRRRIDGAAATGQVPARDSWHEQVGCRPARHQPVDLVPAAAVLADRAVAPCARTAANVARHGVEHQRQVARALSIARAQKAAREPLRHRNPLHAFARFAFSRLRPSGSSLPFLLVMDGARGNPRAVRRARQNDGACAESKRRAINLRMSTWMARRNPYPAPSSRLDADPIPASRAAPASERTARISHPQPGPTPPQPRFDAGGSRTAQSFA